MSRCCLVTGGAGFIGSHLADHLVAENWAVTVLDDFSTGTRANLSEAQSRGDVRIAQGSILDPRAIEAAMAGSDVVFHLAAQPIVRESYRQPVDTITTKATGMMRRTLLA